jgi:hypothetical protein
VKRLIPLALIAAVVLSGSAHAAKPTKLVGSVGPGFTITLKNAAGQKVTRLKRGLYAITVTDRSGAHNFHLLGPGVNKLTSVAGTGRQTFNVTLKAGTYRFRCDPHRLDMKGSFTVR